MGGIERVFDGGKARVICRYDEAIAMEQAEAVRLFGNGWSKCRGVRELACVPVEEYTRMASENAQAGGGQRELNERLLRWVVTEGQAYKTVPILNVGDMIKDKRQV